MVKKRSLADDLRALRPYLPIGYQRRLAEEFNVSYLTVNNVLMGRSRRFDIIKRMMDLAEENKKVVRQLKEMARDE